MKTNTLDFDAQALRDKILDLAMRGQLVPQDPNDEPASVLLEKIKAEKERAELEEKNITDALNDEISRAEAKETEIENQLVDTSKSPFTMSVASGKNQTSLTLPSKDNLDEHSIKIMLDCNFGEI